jgi:Secretion system C-terminal sorting domain
MKKTTTLVLCIVLTLTLVAQNKQGFRFASVFGLTAASISSSLLDKSNVVGMGVGLDSTNTWGALIVAIDTASGKVLKSNCVHLDFKTNFLPDNNVMQKTLDGGYISVYVPQKQNGSILVKFNKNLEKEFVKFLPDTNITKDLCDYSKIISLKDGYFLAGHRFYNNNTVQKHFLQKIDLNGNRLWEKTYDGLKKDSIQYITSLVKISDNSFAIALFNAYVNSDELKATYQSKVFLVDSLGKIQKTLLSPKDSSFKVIGLQKVQGGWIYGTSRYKIQPASFKALGSLLYLIRTDENFQPIWQKKLRFWGATFYNQLYDVRATADGNFVAVGAVQNYYNYKKGNVPQIEESISGYIHKFNINGDSIWARRDTMFYYDKPKAGGYSGFYSAVPLPSGAVIAVGYSRKNFGMGASNETDYAWVEKISKDGCVEEITCQSTTTTSEIASIPIQVYPNPTSGVLNIVWDKAAYNFSVLKIYDLNGKILFINSLENTDNSARIDLSLSPEGLYFYELKGASVTQNGKFILQKN